MINKSIVLITANCYTWKSKLSASNEFKLCKDVIVVSNSMEDKRFGAIKFTIYNIPLATPVSVSRVAAEKEWNSNVILN